MIQAQETLTFDDVTVDFTWEEWQLLIPPQKDLYQEVMLENYSNLLSVGYQARKPDILSKLDQGEPWTMEDEIHCRTHSGYQASKPDAVSRLERGELWPVEDDSHVQICPGPDSPGAK
ncbi:zinc finger protein 350-like isoform X5 [Physeter macrocephalus]|uniref:Zinc finger protein 350-like isoform X5 n=1 Tax=Physeter macrocephalus TaxID=9755 RepID=A0A9W2W738_PHYMC|nr:zinc finger protein 350-like isoform X5 [Physeter catodon]